MAKRYYKPKSEEISREISTPTIFDPSESNYREALGFERQSIEQLESDSRGEEYSAKKVQVSKKHGISVKKPANQSIRRVSNKRSIGREASQFSLLESIIIAFRVIIGYCEKDNSISFTVKRQTTFTVPLTKEKVLDNFKKGVGSHFVEYSKDKAHIKLGDGSGDAMHSLDVWNSLFDQKLRDGKFPERSKPLIKELKNLGNIFSEQDWISHFLAFISEFDPREFANNRKIIPENIPVYIEASALMAIQGRVLGQILEGNLKYISYLKIKKWNADQVEFMIRFGSGNQKELAQELEKCVNPHTIYSFDSNNPNAISIQDRIVSQDEEKKKVEEEKEEECMGGNRTRNAPLTIIDNSLSNENIIDDRFSHEYIADNSNPIPKRTLGLIPSKTHESLEKQNANLSQIQPLESDYRLPEQQFDWNEGLDLDRVISEIYENSEFHKNSKYQYNEDRMVIDNPWAQYG